MQKVLVVGPSWVGDMVMAQSLFRLLKQENTHLKIDVIAPGWCKPLLERMPEVNQTIEMPFGHGVFKPSARLAMGKSLRSENYDQAIVLPYSWKSALVPFGAKIPKRTGFVGELRYGLLNDIRRLDKKQLPLMVQRYLALGLSETKALTDYPKPKLYSDEKTQQAVLSKLDLEKPANEIVAFCPGAEYGPAKQWPANNFSALAKKLIAEGKTVWILGSGNDKKIADEINELAENQCINLCGKTTLQDAIDLLAISDAAVCNDSGLMHVAAAVDTKLVAIYGSSDPSFTPPLSDKVAIAKVDIECAPCFKRECKFGHYNCLRNISADNVKEQIHAL